MYTFERRIIKEIIENIILLPVLLLPTIYCFFYTESFKLLGTGYFLLIFAFSFYTNFRSLFNWPMKIEIQGNELKLYFYKKDRIVIPVDDIDSVYMMIRSKRTAFIEINYKNTQYQLHKARYRDFVELGETLERFCSETDGFSVVTFDVNPKTTRTEYDRDESWDVFLTTPYMLLDLLKDWKYLLIVILLEALIILMFLAEFRNEIYVPFNIFFSIGLVGLVLIIVNRFLGFGKKESGWMIVSYLIGILMVGFAGFSAFSIVQNIMG